MRSSGLQEVKCLGADNGLCSALHSQFATEVIDVLLHRVHTQDKAVGDLAVGGTCKQQAQYLALARSQRFHKRIGVRRGEGEI